MKSLFKSLTGQEPVQVTEFSGSGSNRRYFRLQGGGKSVIGVIGTSKEENLAFINLSRHFREKDIPVPAVLAVSPDGLTYLQEDLGDNILFNMVSAGRTLGAYNAQEEAMLCDAIGQLPKLQFEGADGLDWSTCLWSGFDGRMVDFDLNYFKYCFLKTTGLEFNETLLQDDFDKLKANLLAEDSNTFMHRDFQARNIMVYDGKPWIIDFQGGRRGPIYYDVASFIWQASSRFPQPLKEKLIRAYLDKLRKYRNVDEEHFMQRLRLFVLFRTLQVLGCYGFRGYFEKKQYFIDSVPFAMENLRGLLEKPFTDYPYLNSLLNQMAALPRFQPASSKKADDGLEVHIFSFSLKKGAPEDSSGNGGGYVFDCRAIHNPGRYERYRQFNGTDKEVIDFLEDDGEVTVFLDSVYKIVDAHVKRFLERGFTHLQVSFGCTGGQHRSVYCAEHLGAHIKELFPEVKVHVTHREMKIDKVL
ncbi:MAG: phosphotransferase [Bacteroidales bacterium]|nr:phosphotransferase [Bacteroidales bacterium]